MCKAKVIPLVDEAIYCSKAVLSIIAAEVMERKYKAYYTPFLPSKHFFPMKLWATSQAQVSHFSVIHRHDLADSSLLRPQ
ncbi:hypothetical protein DL93DRAFT_2080551 [Clavulina sp. PMI_390]|nr:hypothetical protein DL93DRAFT_2080551 [Clavulina sp. PMI_390]